MYGIEKAREKVLAAVEGLSDEELNAELDPGRWTIAQVLEHLVLIEQSVTAQLEKTLADENSGPARRKKPIEGTLDRSYKVKAPAWMEPEKRFFSGKEMMARLHNSRKRLLQVVDTAEDREVLEKKSAKHPVFGTMDLGQWIEFIGLHERRHLGQIEDLKAKL